MATVLKSDSATPAYHKSNGVVEVREIAAVEKPSLLILYEAGQESIVGVVADVLGQTWTLAHRIQDADGKPSDTIVGVPATEAKPALETRNRQRLVINMHCVDAGEVLDEYISTQSDYEYLYTRTPFFRRDLARFLSLVLGQIGPHRDLAKKTRTTLICFTFPDVHAALPNLDILSVGADAIELRVDLLKEPLPDGSFSPIPSIKYVGEQLMTLRQRTELPIIFTTRCTKENGGFPMDDPSIFFQYLSRAIQWGCEYIDVELWLPEEIRRTLAQNKGNSKIISAFHDFSGTFRWTSPEAQDLFKKGAVYADVVKMIALVNTVQENYELEYFRSTIKAKYDHPPLSGLNMGPMGQLSRALNRVFTPITHPLLPMIAAPGQLSAAQINTALHSMGQMPQLDIFAIGTYRSATQAMFFEKCFNELSLPHRFKFIEKGKGARSSPELMLRQADFGGAYINPPIAANASFLPNLSDAAKAIGQVDTLHFRAGHVQIPADAEQHQHSGPPSGSSKTLIGDNAVWKGIRATLSRDFVPSAYGGRAALILASAESDAGASIFALKSLGIGPIYTIGFRMSGPLGNDVSPIRSIEDVKRLEHPFVLISALPAEKSLLVGPLLKHYSTDGRGPGVTAGKVFVDLADGPRSGNPLAIASSLGWTAYGIADVSAWTTVETLRLLVGQNVPYDFVRLASG